MASPQKENGYTAIANDLYDAIIRWHLSSYEISIVWCVIRKTYGWQKKEDWISLSQFVEATSISKPHICRALNLLLKQKILIKRKKGIISLYGIQKDYDKWVVLPPGIRSHHPIKGTGRKLNWMGKDKGGSIKGGKRLDIKGAHTKETNTQKKDMRNYNEENPYEEKAIDLETGEEVHLPVKGVGESMKSLLSWAEERRGFKFVNVIKQLAALKKARSAKIQPYHLKERWEELERDQFWAKRGFDWMDVVSSFNKRAPNTP